jgi:pimeloyl-ACP methyl ester carboxylesterase
MFTNTSTTSGTASFRHSTGTPRPLLHDVTGHGQPIVLVPGTLTGWASWVAHAERLSATRQVVRVQLRNVELAEQGTPVPASYGVQDEVDGLLATVDAMGLDRFDLAGWSLGGLVALAFSMEHPARVRTLTLVEPAAVWLLRETGYQDPEFAREESADRELAGTEITIADLKTFLVRAGIGDENTNVEAHPRWPLMVRNRQVLSTVISIWDYRGSLKRLRQLDVPILAVRGGESTRTDRSIVAAIVENAPNASLLELPGDHSCHIEHLDAFLEALERHLGR